MQFGVQFFPDVRPEDRSAEQYFREALDIAGEADRLGYSTYSIIEHFFFPKFGASPKPAPPRMNSLRRSRSSQDPMRCASTPRARSPRSWC